MTEEQFLAEIAAFPAEHSCKLVYADWLEEHGDPRGELIRLLLQLENTSEPRDRIQELHSAQVKLRSLATAEWLRRLGFATPSIHNCHYYWRIRCPQEWAQLSLTGSKNERLCHTCGERVHYCSQQEEAEQRVAQGQCVVVDSAAGVTDELRGESPPGHVLDRSELEYTAGNASNAIGLGLSMKKLRRLSPDLAHDRWAEQWIDGIKEYLRFGDSRAALVIDDSPLTVAAYSKEMDCVALLHFPHPMVDEYQLEPMKRLLAVITHVEDDRVPDLIPGPAWNNHYVNFCPLIADFLSDEMDIIEQRKGEIDESEWNRCLESAEETRSKVRGPYRPGDPIKADKPVSNPPPVDYMRPVTDFLKRVLPGLDDE